MKKYFYKPLVLSFKEEVLKDGAVYTDGLIDYSTLVEVSTYASVPDMIRVFEEKGYVRLPLFINDTGEYLGDVFFDMKEKRPLLGVYRFQVEYPYPIQYIVQENIRSIPEGPMRVRWSEVISDYDEAVAIADTVRSENDLFCYINPSVELIVGLRKVLIKEGEFGKSLPFPHNVDMYMEDRSTPTHDFI